MNHFAISHVMSQLPTFPDEDQRFWWTATAPSLARLLVSCKYSTEQQAAHLEWYRRFIPKALGPRPIPGRKGLFVPCPVFDGSACEHSINWKEHSSSRVVRFTIEAVGREAGSWRDPFNQDETRRMLVSMLGVVPGLSLKRFDTFARRLFITQEGYAELTPRIPNGTPLSQAWTAFDLLHGGVMAKVYFMPILKMIETGKSTNDLVFDTVRDCNSKEYGTFDGPISLLQDYTTSFTAAPYDVPVVEMVAIDCIDSPNSRIKLYLRTAANTFHRVKDMFTLGGRLSGPELDEGVAALVEIWPILFRLDPRAVDIENLEVFPRGSYCGCAIEMKPGQKNPETKIHIPVRKIAGTDAQLCESLATWFRKRGHAEFASQYKTDLESAFPAHDLERTRGTHTFVSFSYTRRTGVYMTMYYSTKILDIHARNSSMVQQSEKDIWRGYDQLWRSKSRIVQR
ncbi:hypothetical protein S40285_08212 [Stachybotrys chlorohalonatus IBT 40285]|uniref:Uncharacterized protein n=1 Tax=Stachybotrys chlorohalonatus (strain IBT 40285) TaxID=1283841 RepID=A0A084R248_STAC4|nr:hypothetical protein S40285_08212 [Stachybotrys chlorohalonata IBT 40285]